MTNSAQNKRSRKRGQTAQYPQKLRVPAKSVDYLVTSYRFIDRDQLKDAIGQALWAHQHAAFFHWIDSARKMRVFGTDTLSKTKTLAAALGKVANIWESIESEARDALAWQAHQAKLVPWFWGATPNRSPYTPSNAARSVDKRLQELIDALIFVRSQNIDRGGNVPNRELNAFTLELANFWTTAKRERARPSEQEGRFLEFLTDCGYHFLKRFQYTEENYESADRYLRRPRKR